MDAKGFITKALADATTTFEFFDKLVAKMDADAARIAELEAKHAARTRELITWIQIAVGPQDGIQTQLAAKAKVEALHKELGE